MNYVDPNFYRGELPALPEGMAEISSCVGGSMYTFKKKGDVITTHSHPSGGNHISFLMKGKIRYQQEGQDDIVYTAPVVLVVPENVNHGFVGETAGAVLINIAMRFIR